MLARFKHIRTMSSIEVPISTAYSIGKSALKLPCRTLSSCFNMNESIVVPDPIHWRIRWINEEKMIFIKPDIHDKELTVEGAHRLPRLRILFYSNKCIGNHRTQWWFTLEEHGRQDVHEERREGSGAYT